MVVNQDCATPFHPADRAHRVLDAPSVGVPERLELGLVLVVDVLADIGINSLNFGVAAASRVKARILFTIGSGVLLGANRPTQR
jgi:hypothetical protein